MKLREKLAREAVEKRDLISNEKRNLFGEGFLEGFQSAWMMAVSICYLNSGKAARELIWELGNEDVPG